MNIMLDLETLGTKPGSIILAIGAVYFDKDGIGERFYTRISMTSSCSAGLNVDPLTVEWWLKQSKEAQNQAFCGTSSIQSVLVEFCYFVTNHTDDVLIWGNGVAFDNALLRAAYECCKIRCPWTYKQDMCYHSLKNLFKDLVPVVPFDGIKHNALDDAINQAQHAVNILNYLEL